MDLINKYKLHPNVIIGEDGELFLSGGAHQVEDFILGIKEPSLNSFENFDSNIKFRMKVSEDIGAQYVHIVCPDKQTIYSNNYPIKNTKALGDLYKEKCSSSFLYPVHEIGSDGTYFRTDSHWNPTGALRATKHVLDKFNINYTNENQRLSLSTTIEQSGDLGGKLTPQLREFVEHYKENLFKITLCNEHKGNDGLIKICINPEAQEDSRLLIFGDSFMMCCLSYFSDVFKYVIFVRSRHFHPELVYSYRPTHIISSNVERYLSHVDSDKNASNIFLLAFMKGLDFESTNDFYTTFSALTSLNTAKINEVLFIKLQELIKNKEFESVDRITKTMMLHSNKEDYLYLLRSRNFMAAGNLDDGISLAKDLLEKSDRSVIAIEHIASCYLQKKEFHQSLNFFNEAISKSKNRYSLYKGKSICLKNLEKYDEALKFALIALEISNSSPDVVQLVSELETLSND